MFTTGRLQSKTLLTIDERGSKLARNNDFDCHLSLVGRQKAIKNSVSNDFLSSFVDSINVFDCHLHGVTLADGSFWGMHFYGLVKYSSFDNCIVKYFTYICL